MTNAVYTMDYDLRKKSLLAAYLHWIFLGLICSHRFYLGDARTAVKMLLINFFGIACLFLSIEVLSGSGEFGTAAKAFAVVGGIAIVVFMLWITIDGLLIPGMVRRYNEALMQRLSALPGPATAPAVAPAPGGLQMAPTYTKP